MFTQLAGILVIGSSPHKWGLLEHSLIQVPYFRFIPTQVGNAENRGRVLALESVHPHTSGEYVLK